MKEKKMTELEERIGERIEQLKKQRDQFVLQANQQVAACNGAISELEQLLKPPAEQPAKDTEP